MPEKLGHNTPSDPSLGAPSCRGASLAHRQLELDLNQQTKRITLTKFQHLSRRPKTRRWNPNPSRRRQLSGLARDETCISQELRSKDSRLLLFAVLFLLPCQISRWPDDAKTVFDQSRSSGPESKINPLHGVQSASLYRQPSSKKKERASTVAASHLAFSVFRVPSPFFPSFRSLVLFVVPLRSFCTSLLILTSTPS